MQPWLDLQVVDAPDGMLEWSRGYPTLEDAFAGCPSAEWRLWLATYHATSDAEHLRCARAALHVARVAMEGLPAPAIAAEVLDRAERWAVNRSQDEGYAEALEALEAVSGTSPLPALVRCAAWFADFEACVGIDGAANVRDLFVEACALVRKSAGGAGEAALLQRLASELRTQLPTPRVATG